MEYIDQRLRDATPDDPDGRTVRFVNEASKLHDLTGTLLYLVGAPYVVVKMHDDGRAVSADVVEIEEVTGH